MKALTTKLFTLAASLAIAGTSAYASGFQHGFVVDPEGKPLEIGIWYPSQVAALPIQMGPTTMSVAVNGQIQGTALPLVMMSHGSGGSFLGHFDTAIARWHGEFLSASTESAFLRDQGSVIQAELTRSLSFCGIFFLAFALVDLAHLGYSPQTMMLFIARLAIAMVALASIVLTRRSTSPGPTAYRAATVFTSLTMLTFVLIMTALSFIPAFVMLMTSFTRIIIVFSILRQALGLQQTPDRKSVV